MTTGDRPVAVVTGGGGGIGAAVAEQLGRDGWYVVTVDPLVSLDGSEPLPRPDETTAGRIVAAGGAARASDLSVTDREAVHDLLVGLVDELGRLDAVVNVAGISRPTSFARGTEEDWRRVLAVHLDGYLNVLMAAVPVMAAAGRGRILGVTSGSGWRQADAGAYGCAKRAVASLTWQLGRQAPPGVVVNAMSPIAVTRMVTAALGRAGASSAARSGGAATGGLSLAAMPAPEQLGPLAAHLVSEGVTWCRGQVLFAGGSEVAVIDEPRLLEVVRADPVASLAQLLETVTPGALAPAESAQVSTGGSNPRFGPIFDQPDGAVVPSAAVASCAVVSDRPDVAAGVVAALEERSVAAHVIAADGAAGGFDGATAALDATEQRVGPFDAIVVALAGALPADPRSDPWERVLAEHRGVADQICRDAGWARAVADHAARTDRPLRLVTLIDATTAGGRSRAQASAQLARAARGATGERVVAFAVSVETAATTDAHLDALGQVAAHLACSPEAPALSGAELVVGPGWFGLRSHPRPRGSVVFGGPGLPGWLDGTLADIVGAPDRRGEEHR